MAAKKKKVATEAGLGHNSAGTSESKARLRTYIKRIEKLEEDKTAITEDIGEVYAEAKGTCFDVPIMRKLITRRKMEESKRKEQDELLDLYEHAMED